MTASTGRRTQSPSGGPRLGTRVRRGLGTTGLYALLIAFAIIFMFPFVYMLTTALKTSEEFYRYPPQLLPMQAATAAVSGEELPLYRIPVDGRQVEMVPVETGVRAGICMMAVPT